MYFRYNWNKSRIVKPTHNAIIVGGDTRRGQRGQVLVFVTLALFALFGFVALAVDAGNLMLVRNELQNAADAAALTIVPHVYPLNGTTHEPDWDAAKASELGAIQMNNLSMNRSNDVQLTDGQVTYGYWEIPYTGAVKQELRPLPIARRANDFPAVRVTIRKSSGHNGGGVPTIFARVIGINSLDASATAVAVISSPGYTKNSLMPIAIPSCLYSSQYWDSSTDTPTTPPTTFSLGSTIAYSGCGGQSIEAEWTSLNTGANSTKEIRQLIDYATGTAINPDQPQLAIGSSIHIETGVHDTLYTTPQQTSVNGCSAAGNRTCEYAIVPVVNQICTNCDRPIQGFACVHILSADAGGSKRSAINIQLVAMGTTVNGKEVCKLDNSGGAGPAYGAKLPPKLVQ